MNSRLELAIAAGAAAGQRTLHAFNSLRYRVETKADGSPVTTADKEAEEELRRLIEGAFPDDGILGEEFPEKPGSSGFRWVIDPIDGTRSFVRGVPLYGVLVAVERERRSVAGAIVMPALGERVYAARGLGAWQVAAGSEEARPARVSRTVVLAEALACITSFGHFGGTEAGDTLLRIIRGCGAVRGWSDCYAHLLVATGRADAGIEPVMHPWDSAASTVIIEEAGGRYTDWQGTATAHATNAVLSNGLVHEELLAILSA